VRGVPAVRQWLPFIVVGITSGSIYALAAMGLVLTFKTSGIFNFGHGAQAAMAAYVMFELRERNGLPWPVAGLLTLLLAGVLAGLVMELAAKALAEAPPAARVGATVGLLVGIQGGLFAVFGSKRVQMRFFLPTHLVRFADVNIRVEQIIVTAIALASAVGLYWYMGRTRVGVATLGVVDDPALLGLTGTNPMMVRRSAWIIGSSFAAVSGMLLAPTAGLDAGTLTLLVFFAFGAAAIGAFNSLPMTYVGGLGIGLGSEILKKFFTHGGAIAALPSTLPFLVLFAVLLVIPKQKLVERGSAVVRRQLPPLALPAPAQRVAAVTGVVLLFALPHLVGTRTVTYTNALCFVILFSSLSLLVRMSGQISLCQMTFAAVGGATFAHAMSGGFPWPVAVLVAGLVTVPVGALVAIPAIRLSGVYLAVATFGFALLVQDLVFPSSFMFSNFSKVLKAPRPKISWLHTQTDTGYYYVVLAIGLVCVLLIVGLRRSRLGRLLRGLAEGAVALDAHGTNTNITRLLVFCASAFFAGIAGAVIAPISGSVSPPPYDFTISLLLVAVLFIAGRQPVLGAFVAAGLYIVVPGYIPQGWLKWTPVLFGGGAVLAAMFGGLPVVDRIRTSKRAMSRSGRPSPASARFRAAASNVGSAHVQPAPEPVPERVPEVVG
jgi:ABC-type branched-subunit amino acid transport system permease subunit